MKVIWLCNYPLPCFCDGLTVETTVNESWLVNLSTLLIEKKNVSILFVFPIKGILEQKQGTVAEMNYCAFPAIGTGFSVKAATVFFAKLLKTEKPDVIHIMGTEFSHSQAMVEAAVETNFIDRVIVSIQGMPYFYAKHVNAGLPPQVTMSRTFKDIIRKTGMRDLLNQFIARGETEKKVIGTVRHVMGRTTWDKACVSLLNNAVIYHHGGEILRESFYNDSWSLEKAERHSLFLPQAHYPIKGFHFALEALNEIACHYSDVKLYVAGRNVYENQSWKKTAYEKYICELIRRYNLKDKIVFLGRLQEEQMKQAYLRSHVFILTSLIENSPNSLGEAMALGMPIVSANVGGVSDMLVDRQEGFLFPCDEPYILASYVMRFFNDDNLACVMGERAKVHALQTHNKTSIVNEVYATYQTLLEQETK